MYDPRHLKYVLPGPLQKIFASPQPKVLLENGFQMTVALCCHDGPEDREVHSLVEESCTVPVNWAYLEPGVKHSSGNCIAASAEYYEE